MKTDKQRWELQEKEIFAKIKHIQLNSSLSVHFDYSKVVFTCDASLYGLEAVLYHEPPKSDFSNAFTPHSQNKAEWNYSHIEKETLALVFGIRKFHNYFLDCRFKLLTDHCPLVMLLSENNTVLSVAAANIHSWSLTFSAYF